MLNEMKKIISLAHKVSNLTSHDVFVRYSGHVNLLEIDVHLGGWQQVYPADYYKQISLPCHKDYFMETIKYLETLLKEGTE